MYSVLDLSRRGKTMFYSSIPAQFLICEKCIKNDS